MRWMFRSIKIKRGRGENKTMLEFLDLDLEHSRLESHAGVTAVKSTKSLFTKNPQMYF